MPGRGTSAPGWNSQPHPRTALLGTIYGAGRGVGDEDGCIQSGGKALPRKSPKTDFSSALGNPAQPAGFPLSHRPGGCWLTETGQLMCYENRTFSLATDTGTRRMRGGPRPHEVPDGVGNSYWVVSRSVETGGIILNPSPCKTWTVLFAAPSSRTRQFEKRLCSHSHRSPP